VIWSSGDTNNRTKIVISFKARRPEACHKTLSFMSRKNAFALRTLLYVIIG
jgi:hypothetical protein